MGAVVLACIHLSCSDPQVHRSGRVHGFFLEFQEMEATAIRETGKPAERRMAADLIDRRWPREERIASWNYTFKTPDEFCVAIELSDTIYKTKILVSRSGTRKFWEFYPKGFAEGCKGEK